MINASQIQCCTTFEIVGWHMIVIVVWQWLRSSRRRRKDFFQSTGKGRRQRPFEIPVISAGRDDPPECQNAALSIEALLYIPIRTAQAFQRKTAHCFEFSVEVSEAVCSFRACFSSRLRRVLQRALDKGTADTYVKMWRSSANAWRVRAHPAPTPGKRNANHLLYPRHSYRSCQRYKSRTSERACRCSPVLRRIRAAKC